MCGRRAVAKGLSGPRESQEVAWAEESTILVIFLSEEVRGRERDRGMISSERILIRGRVRSSCLAWRIRYRRPVSICWRAGEGCRQNGRRGSTVMGK